MALAFFSTTPGTSSDYRKYLYAAPKKNDRDGNSVLLDFALVPGDASFVKLNRGNYVKFTTATYPVWFTGYITNEPQYTYLGMRGHQPVWGYAYEASSDDIILSQNALGIIPPFINTSQGNILKALAEIIAPGLFDYTNVHNGMTLARYVVDPTKKFSDVAKEFCDSAVHRFYGLDKKLYFQSKSTIATGLTIDGNDLHFTPGDLTLQASTNQPIINDAVVIGDIEPQTYVNEYFIGSGFDAQESLIESVYGVNSSVLLDDDFASGTIDKTKWIVYDQPANYLRLSNGYLNVVGGSGAGAYDAHLDSANLIPLSGAINITHGDFDFVPQTSDNLDCGVIGGLWTAAPNSAFTGCLYGLRIHKASGAVSLNPIVAGVVDTSQVVAIDPVGNAGATPPAWSSTVTYSLGNKVSYSGTKYEAVASSLNVTPGTNPSVWAVMVAPRYVIRTVFSAQRVFRSGQTYNYIKADGTVGTYGGTAYADVITASTYVTEIDVNTGAVTAGFPKVLTNSFTVLSTQAYATYILVASNDLHLSVSGVTVSTPMQASLSIQPKGATSFVNKLIGPNVVDASDGLSPYATIVQTGGTAQKQTILGSPKYNPGDAQLTFFKNTALLQSTIPQKGDVIRLKYRGAGMAIGRARDASSISAEGTNWGDSGVRSVVRNNMSPLPQTSEDCEAAAAALIGQNAYTHYEGQYTVISKNVTAEPQAGAILPFINLPSSAFPITSFKEPVYQVQTTFEASRGQEIFIHTISFGLKGDSQRLLQTLASFQKQSDVFAPQDAAIVPPYVAVASIGLAYAADVTNLSLDMTGGHPLGVDATKFYLDCKQAAPSGGGFEVRYSDDSWSTTNPGKNLVLRTGSQTFSVLRCTRNKVLFVKAYDASGLYSRYAACIHIAHPNIPNPPTAIIGNNPSVPPVTYTPVLIAPNTEAVFTSASSADKLAYMFLCDDTGHYSDGTAANVLT